MTFEVQKKTKKKLTEQVLGTVALSGGSATLTVKPKSVLKKPVTVLYGGDADFQASNSTAPMSAGALALLVRWTGSIP